MGEATVPHSADSILGDSFRQHAGVGSNRGTKFSAGTRNGEETWMEPHGFSRGVHPMFNRFHSSRRPQSLLPGRRYDRDRGLFGSVARDRDMATGRRLLGLEWLEPRQLLTGIISSVAAVQPYNGAQLSQS